MKKLMSICLILFGLFTIIASGDSPEAQSTYPRSSATYEELNAEVGCHSKYSSDKKDDIFESRYKNHWMVWRGKVVLASSDNVSLDIDGGLQDLCVVFTNKKAGYNLIEGRFITVKFVMKHSGGCFLPFSGNHAVIME